MRLFCFPFSGASALVFFKWFDSIHSEIQICPVELAGRGKRFKEPLVSSMDWTVRDLVSKLSQQLEAPYALFGHSLGCLLIYEFVQILINDWYPMPEHVFLSGGMPPHFGIRNRWIHTYSDQQFLVELTKMGGLVEKFLTNKKLQDIFLPIIRSDYKMYETYMPRAEKLIFPCGMTVFVGDRDEVSDIECSRKWSEYSNGDFNLITYEGGHFFINKHFKEIASVIRKTLFKKVCHSEID